MNESTIVERYEVDWSNDKEILNYITSRWQAKDFYKGGLEKKWLKILACYEGFPYIEYDEVQRILVDELEVPSWRVNLVVNLLLPKIRTIAAKHLRNRPIWDVLPATNDTADINRALKSKKSLQSFWYNQEIDYDFIQILLWLGITGNAFVNASWNPNIGPEYTVSLRDFISKELMSQLQELPLEDSQKQQMLLTDAQEKFQAFVKQNGGVEYPLGEVEINVPTPFDILFPFETRFSRIPWLICGQIREISYYVDMGIDPSIFTTPTEKEARFFYFAKRHYNLFNLGLGTQYAAHKNREVLELQLWLPKSKQFRKGFHAVAAGGQIISKGENPYNHREIPFVHFKAETTPGKIVGFSSAEMAIPIINEYQRTKSQLTECKNLMAKPKWLAPRTARIDDNALTSEPGEVITYSGAIAPSQAPLSPIPQYVMRLPEMDRRDVDDIMAIHDASAGVNPSGSRSGLMNVNLQEQDDGQLSISGLDLDKGLSKLGRLVLSVQDQFYKEERLIKIVGPRNRFEISTLKPGELSGNSEQIGIDYFQVRVAQFSQFGLSRAGQLEALKVLLQYNVFKENERDKVLKFLNIGFIEDSLDDFQIDRANAYKENLLMSQGQLAEVDLSDEDKIHIEEHQNFQKGDDYKVLPPEIRSLFQEHMQRHKLYLIMKQIEPQILMVPAQVLAMTLNKINPKLMEMFNAGRSENSGQGNGSKGNSGSKGNGSQGQGK